MKRLEQLNPTLLRLATHVESLYLSNKLKPITLEFPSYGAALSFRLDFYNTRKFLNNLRERNKPEALAFASAISGLNRLSCARCDKEPALKHLADYGYVPLHFKPVNETHIDLSSQLDALGIPPLDPSYNPATMRNADFARLSSPSDTSPQDLYTPTHQPSAEIHLTDRSSLPSSITIFDQTFTTQDVFASSAHENLHKLSLALLEPSTPVSQTKVKLFRRKLLESSNITPSLRSFLLSDLFPS